MELNSSILARKNKFFSNFEEGEVRVLLNEGVINRYNRGDCVFLKGDPGEALYIILTGEVEILLENREGLEEVLAILGPGDVFGEGSFATKSRRSAKAVAVRDTYLYAITTDHMQKLLEKSAKITAKMLLELLKITCQRLSITNIRLSK